MILPLLALALLGAQTPDFKSSETLAIKSVTLPEEKTRFKKMEIKVDLHATYSNAFHEAQVSLVAHFVGPRNTEMVLPGFYYQGFTRSLANGKETVTKVGEPEWRVRFTPTLVGHWYVTMKATDRSGEVNTDKFRFDVKESTDPGFLRIATSTHNIEYSDQEDLHRKIMEFRKQSHFHFDNGKSFFGVGVNMAWSGDKGTFQYEDWFDKFATRGGNLVRIWSHPNGLGLEWGTKGGRGTFYGLGKYSLDNAWLLDRVIEAAEQRGIKIILCLGTYGELKADKGMWNEQLWDVNPYNVANGGPCGKPDDFFTDLKARAFYRQRLRYLVARYASSPAILSWELWNEVNAPVYWVHEMAQELHELDPYDHAVTTSYGDAQVWRDKYVDMMTSHIYGDGKPTDLAERIAKGGKQEIAPAVEPNMVTELGIDFARSDAEIDTNGTAINLRVGLWQAAASGYAAGGMNWWWDSYVDKLDIWRVYRPFADAVVQVPWAKSAMLPVANLTLPDGIEGAAVLNDYGGFVWLRQKSYNWKDWKPETKATLPFLLELVGAKSGTWDAIWWDTQAGKEISREEIKLSDQTLHLRAPSFGSDVALILLRR